MRPSLTTLRLLAAATGLALALTACGGGDDGDAFTDSEGGGGGDASSSEAITVGGATFTASAVMIEAYRALLEDAGYTVETKPVENRELYAPELESGTIDVVPEYAGTFTEYLNLDENGPGAEPLATSDVDETIEALRPLAEERGLEVLEPAEAADQNAFFVTQDFATQNSLTTLSDLGALGQPIVLAGTQECPERPKCELGLEEVYGLDITEDLPLGYGTLQNKQAVVEGKAQLGLTGTTDATLEGLGLVVLEDDKGLQNAENLVPVVNAEGPAATDEVADLLDSLSEVLSTEDLAELIRRVDEDREEAAAVAEDYLTEEGLIGS
jgi:osmoprotectant transport system substrate-binding protein